MKHLFALAMLLLLFAPKDLEAHELLQRVSRGTAVVIELSYPTKAPFSYEQYEISRSGEEIPFQTGRSDALGRIVFVPDRQGSWRIRAFSEDGHGVDFTIEAGPQDTATAAAGKSGSNRYAKIVLGLVIIFGVFGSVSVFLRRRAA
jgi:nickel transport protein